MRKKIFIFAYVVFLLYLCAIFVKNTMEQVKVIELKKSIFEENDREADALRGELKRRGVFLLNLMSAPGSGKTTTLIETINRLKDKIRIAVMEADIDSDVDAIKIKDATGVESVQLHTGGMCHLDAEMTKQGLATFDNMGIDLVILENVGSRQERDDSVRSRGPRQTSEIPADVLGLRRGGDQQDRCTTLFRFRHGEMQGVHPHAQSQSHRHPHLRQNRRRRRSIRQLALDRSQELAK